MPMESLHDTLKYALEAGVARPIESLYEPCDWVVGELPMVSVNEALTVKRQAALKVAQVLNPNPPTQVAKFQIKQRPRLLGLYVDDRFECLLDYDREEEDHAAFEVPLEGPAMSMTKSSAYLYKRAMLPAEPSLHKVVCSKVLRMSNQYKKRPRLELPLVEPVKSVALDLPDIMNEHANVSLDTAPSLTYETLDLGSFDTGLQTPANQKKVAPQHKYKISTPLLTLAPAGADGANQSLPGDSIALSSDTELLVDSQLPPEELSGVDRFKLAVPETSNTSSNGEPHHPNDLTDRRTFPQWALGVAQQARLNWTPFTKDFCKVEDELELVEQFFDEPILPVDLPKIHPPRVENELKQQHSNSTQDNIDLFGMFKLAESTRMSQAFDIGGDVHVPNVLKFSRFFSDSGETLDAADASPEQAGEEIVVEKTAVVEHEPSLPDLTGLAIVVNNTTIAPHMVFRLSQSNVQIVEQELGHQSCDYYLSFTTGVKFIAASKLQQVNLNNELIAVKDIQALTSRIDNLVLGVVGEVPSNLGRDLGGVAIHQVSEQTLLSSLCEWSKQFAGPLPEFIPELLNDSSVEFLVATLHLTPLAAAVVLSEMTIYDFYHLDAGARQDMYEGVVSHTSLKHITLLTESNPTLLD